MRRVKEKRTQTTDHQVSLNRSAQGPHQPSDLIRQLLSSVERSNQFAPDDASFALDVDGVRCQLTRLKPLSPHPAANVSLSPRELEIARMIARGYANKTIAAVLEISVWTVGTYLRRIFAKLGVGTRAAMVAKLHATRILD